MLPFWKKKINLKKVYYKGRDLIMGEKLSTLTALSMLSDFSTLVLKE